jgi:plastocyanin
VPLGIIGVPLPPSSEETRLSTKLLSARRAGIISLTMLALLLVACSPSGDGDTDGDGDGGGGGTGTVTDGAVTITANELEFDLSTIEAPAGEEFTITFTNMESQPHNVAIYTEEDGDEIAVGDISTGPNVTNQLAVPALEAGTYYFRCDVHPEMEGQLVVS